MSSGYLDVMHVNRTLLSEERIIYIYFKDLKQICNSETSCKQNKQTFWKLKRDLNTVQQEKSNKIKLKQQI